MTNTTATIQGLRDLADFIEQHPDLDCSYCIPDAVAVVLDAQAVADFAAAGGRWEKRAYDSGSGGNFELKRMFGPVTFKVVTPRATVCERKVVGVETVELPDPNAPTITVEREVVEWDCKPILAGGAA